MLSEQVVERVHVSAIGVGAVRYQHADVAGTQVERAAAERARHVVRIEGEGRGVAAHRHPVMGARRAESGRVRQV